MPNFECGGEGCRAFSCALCTDEKTRAEYWEVLSTCRSDAEADRIMRERRAKKRARNQSEGRDMTTKHTPGPWFIGDDNNAGCEVIAGPVAIPLDRTPRCPGGGSEYVISREEMIANSRLIAAAPDLLAACERLLRWAGWPHAEKDIELARAAIAKAKGERQ
jgi:hypothetical protein